MTTPKLSKRGHPSSKDQGENIFLRNTAPVEQVVLRPSEGMPPVDPNTVTKPLPPELVAAADQAQKTQIIPLPPEEPDYRSAPTQAVPLSFPTSNEGAALDPDLLQTRVVSLDVLPGASLESSASLEEVRKSAFSRTTVLPRIKRVAEKAQLVVEPQERYEFVRSLGKGGFGEVALVIDADIKRPVAMKRLHKNLHSPEYLAGFTKEVQTIGQLEHPNIVPVHDVGVDKDGQYYFTMKYVEGETLTSIIRKLKEGDPEYHRRFTFEVRLQIFLAVLHAVDFAHTKGIIHRDLKPSNIMIGPQGEVMVMDWGLAQEIRRKRSNQEEGVQGGELPGTEETERDLASFKEENITGTPAYMSPEQTRGQELDERSDIYSLCVLFYEFLTLTHYLEGASSIKEVVEGVRNKNATIAFLVPNPYQKRVPAELAHFVRKGMAKDPEARYQSVREMIDKIQSNIQGKIAIQCTSTFVKRLSYTVMHLVDRYPIGNAVLMLALLGLLLYNGVSIFVGLF